MKSLRFGPSVLASAAAVLLMSCRLGPVNYDKFEQRTIEENLAAIDSASVIYATQLASGNIDAACAQAQAFLLTQEGVDTAMISPDSIVWAFFSSGLLAGTGDVRRDTTGSRAESGCSPRAGTVPVFASSGGETGDATDYVLPFNVELPGTQQAGENIQYAIKSLLGWGEGEMFKGSEVDLGLALGLINPGTGVTFWSGHGMLFPPEPGSGWASGLMLGKSYTKQSMAEAAVRQAAGYLNPGAGQARQAAVVELVDRRFYIAILPAFIRAHGDFDNAESLPFNTSKTIVYLSCCYSAYNPGGVPGTAGPLMQAFLDAGADLVCGYTWEVGDAWSRDMDTKFFNAMADTCLPEDAYRSLGSVTDPNPGRNGIHAQLGTYGDTLVLLQTVLQAKKDGTLHRSGAGARAEMYGSEVTKLYDWVRQDGSSEEVALVTVLFPSTAPGTFDLFSSGAYISWADIATGRTYWAQHGYVGTSGTLCIDKCAGDLVVGHFNATLGWWEPGKSPGADPPSDAFTLRDGILKYSGKITHVGSAAAPPGPVSVGLPSRY